MSQSGNRLGTEKSPYLLQHRDQPVHWWPYGEEAFEEARRRDVPIFLSIGYSTCHWCHVMAHESFDDPETAALMNRLFVNIKVDREERPDVDHVYMQAVMALAGQGGWPLSAWLTPDLKPFYGGTYFPPEARWGRPSFRTLCAWLADLWETDREKVVRQAGQLAQALAPEAARASEAFDAEAATERARKDLARAYDARRGGFGGAPKFPRPATLAFLQHRAARKGDPEALAMVERTLEMMWRGGIYDHVGGGFARYSTDVDWLVPHFEKMLYDNAQLITVLLEAYRTSGLEMYASIARDVLGWVAREMTDPLGGFHSAQDADSEGEEGRFYIFSKEELGQALGADDAAFLSQVYGVTDAGQFEHKNILHWPRPPKDVALEFRLSEAELFERLAPLRARLYAFREQRVRPGQDDKVIASWNGLMIGAAALAGRRLDDPDALAAAERAAEFVWQRLRSEDGQLLRRWREGEARFEGSLDDYVFLADGLFALYSVTGRARWFGATLELLREVLRRFEAEDGAYWFAEPRSDLITRMKESYDGALPSSNGVLALLLSRVLAATKAVDRKERVLRIVRAFGSGIASAPESHPYLLMAASEAAEAPRTLIVAGPRSDQAFERALRAAHRAGLPGRVIVPIPDEERSALQALGLDQSDLLPPPGRVWALLCENATCQQFTWDS